MAEESPPILPRRDDARARSIVRGLGSLSLQNILNSLMGFVMLAALLRYLSPTEYAAYSSVQVTISLASVLGILGLGSAVVRFLAPLSKMDTKQAWGAAKASLLLSLALSMSVSVVLVVLAPLLSEYFMKSVAWSWVFWLGAAWAFATSVSTVLQATLQALRRYSFLAGALFASRAIAVSVTLVGLIVYQSLEIALLSWVVNGVLVSLMVLSVAWKPLKGASSKEYFGRVLRYSAPLAMSAIVVTITANADIVIVGGLLNPRSLGLYNATIVISNVFSSLFVIPLVTALFAETSFSSESPREVARGLGLAFRFNLLTVLPASLFAFSVASQLFNLFSGGGSYAQGIPYLQLIMLFYLLYAVQSVVIYVLKGIGWTRSVLVVGAATALGEISLSLVLVPTVGLEGAAASRVIVMAIGCGISLYLVRGYLKGTVEVVFIAKAILSSAIPAAATYTLTSEISARVLTLIPYTAIGVTLFLGCAKILRLLGDEDKAFIAHMLPTRLGWVVRLL